jgi:two-component system cell cycle response regulator
LPPFIFGLKPNLIHRNVLPESYRGLLRENWKGEESREDLVDLITADVPLYATLAWLNLGVSKGMVQSPTRKEATDLVRFLGLDMVRDIVLSMVILRSYRMGVCRGMDRDNFWGRALARGVAAQHVGVMLGAKEPLRCFLSGLFVDLGKIVLAETYPDRYSGLLEKADGDDAVLRQLEREAFGVDRNSVAWATLRDYGVSRAVFEPMFFASCELRRRTSSLEPTEERLPDILRIATLIANLVTADMKQRMSLWPNFIKERNCLEVSRDVMNNLGDKVVNDWWFWGDLLTFPTRTVPGFGELSDWNERGAEPKRYNRTGGKSLVANSMGAGLHILLVEDNSIARLANRRKLEKAGHQVDVAVDGIEALALLRQSPPQVILSDWHMPGMDGLELCKYVRSTEFGERMFFILFTGEVDETQIVRAYEAGIDDFIDKKSPLQILLARILSSRKSLQHWESIDRDRRIIRSHCENSRHQASMMKRDSLTDALTDLPNRRYAMDRLREEWARSDRSGASLGLVMMDIDLFKAVNDNHGHDVGDEVLKEVALTLKSVTRRGEAACRIGGEEFLIICSDADLESAARCAERVRKAIEEKVVHAGTFHTNVTVSLGVATKSAATQNLDAFFKAADEAVYHAKENGRNCAITWPGMEKVDFSSEGVERRDAG